jgi:hypothetical protein
MNDYLELPCHKCGRVWKWSLSKKDTPYCPKGVGCRRDEPVSDDLVKRLRDLGDHAAFEPHMHHLAADRIEELEAACWRMKEERDRATGKILDFLGLQSQTIYLHKGEKP